MKTDLAVLPLGNQLNVDAPLSKQRSLLVLRKGFPLEPHETHELRTHGPNEITKGLLKAENFMVSEHIFQKITHQSTNNRLLKPVLSVSITRDGPSHTPLTSGYF